MVIDDHDTVDSSGIPVFHDVGELTGNSLPDLAEFTLLKGFTVTQVQIPRRFQVILFNKALDDADTDCFRNKRVSNQMLVNLGVFSRGIFLNAVDLFNDGIGKDSCEAFVRTGREHENFQVTPLVHGNPFLDGLVVVFHNRTIWQSERRVSNSFVVGSSGRIRVKAWIAGAMTPKRNCATSVALRISSF